MVGIYKITNKVNGKVYIGQSQNIKERWAEHKRPSNFINPTKLLYQAMKEFSLDKFSFEILEECDKTELLNREQYYISLYDSLEPNGYNMQMGQNYRRKISKEAIQGIEQDLIENKLSRKEICEKWNISPSYVSNVNSGLFRVNSKLTYPLRPIMPHNMEKNKCIDCGKEIERYNTRCINCHNKHRKETSHINTTITREELKYKIRHQSFVSIGKEYGISDNGIRKWCKHYDLPTTKREINSYSDEDWEKI